MSLLAEDLLLLLLDDEKGTITSSFYPSTVLGGALLLELALDGVVEVREEGAWRQAKVHPTGLRCRRSRCSSRRWPRSPTGRVPPRTWSTGSARDWPPGSARSWPGAASSSGGTRRSSGCSRARCGRPPTPPTRTPVRRRLGDVLVRGLTPDPHSAALVALLHAVGRAHRWCPSSMPAATVEVPRQGDLRGRLGGQGRPGRDHRGDRGGHRRRVATTAATTGGS